MNLFQQELLCIDYRKLNEATAKDHFPLPFMDQMLERLAGNKYFCFLDGFSGYFQIPIDPMDQEKRTFTCPFGTYAYRRMPFGLCNAPATFQRCMLAIFLDMIEESVEVFMDDFSVFGNSFDNCLNNLDKMLQRCKDAHLVLNWEKCHFMVKEGIMLGHWCPKQALKSTKKRMTYCFYKNLMSTFKDRLGIENVVVDHLSWIENEETSDNSEVDDNFPRETLMEIDTRDEPWFADLSNYLVYGSPAYRCSDEAEEPMKYKERGNLVGARRKEDPPAARRITSGGAEKIQSPKKPSCLVS
ncbi:reverse transcriptase domain-containing protein [Tanacetum coccineum]